MTQRNAVAAVAMVLLLYSSAWALAVKSEKVNLNVASARQLEGLPGIGPALAQRIIDHRKKNGSFTRIEDLMNVRGIGEKSLCSWKTASQWVSRRRRRGRRTRSLRIED